MILARNINYIKYIETKNPQTLVKQSSNYEILHIGKRNSLYSLLKKYEQNLVNHNNDNEGMRGLNKAKLCKIIKEEFNTLRQTQVNSFPKADTYRQFKNRVKFESYLTDIKNRKLRVTFTKYRLLDHCLVIEKGKTQTAISTQEKNTFAHFVHQQLKIKSTFLPSVAHTKIKMNYSFNMIRKGSTQLC